MSTVVTVVLVSPDTRSERRFGLHISVEQLKSKVELITGIPVRNQRISVQDSEGETIAQLSDDARPLGFYGLTPGQTLNVIDTNPATSFTGQLSDVSQVEKFELSEDAYAKRTDSVLAYKQRNKVGRFAPPSEAVSPHVADVNIPLGARCQVESTEQGLLKRGTVRFVGQTVFSKAGVWAGIEYDEPIGRNDGSVQGERYFTCRPNYGVFVRPDRVQVGDFPPEEINFDDEEM